ncbi:alpha/beta fold hydrolase [Acuticoccus sp. I52.16.1]|uniref:alpha/beta fold hydrolase n=1 Tax=Acuticoccus sp. I52.16.1 TaxID=2928472 RepID=UPI001FD4131E|nr:alpha/beta fold hydrolase [Acuticoccus sp. I52.16.1]UOM34162.1 alpha/beta fold hydrolase [Acuticoccus sp. I52.16.1]
MGGASARPTQRTTPVALDTEIFEAGPFTLQSGATLAAATIAYKTYGTLAPAKDNVVVLPTAFAGRHSDYEWMIGPGQALDPARLFVIIPNMLGNGLSSSPSNTPAPHAGPDFPAVTIHDNVVLQQRLLAEVFAIERVALVVGRSMGALQAFHWGALFPERVARIAAIVGASRCSRHNFVFLEGVKAALGADAAFADGRYTAPPEKGLRAMGRVYAGWGFSQAFYRREEDRTAFGYATLEDFLAGFWDPFFAAKDANDLLAMIATWQHADIAANDRYRGDRAAALGAITARAFVMPSQTDLYFPPEDSALEVDLMPNAELIPIPSIWGHFAGGRGNPQDAAFLDEKLKLLLAS